jgi:Flp pilus assembly protein TadG
MRCGGKQCRRPSVIARLLRAEGGAPAVEFAIIFPFFFLLMFGIFDFARACWLANSLQFAVASAARYVMMNPTGSLRPNAANCATWGPDPYQSSVNTYLQAQLTAWNVSTAVPSATATVSCGDSPPFMQVKVSASYTFTFVLNEFIGLFPLGIPMSQQATVRIPLG